MLILLPLFIHQVTVTYENVIYLKKKSGKKKYFNSNTLMFRLLTTIREICKYRNFI